MSHYDLLVVNVRRQIPPRNLCLWLGLSGSVSTTLCPLRERITSVKLVSRWSHCQIIRVIPTLKNTEKPALWLSMMGNL